MPSYISKLQNSTHKQQELRADLDLLLLSIEVRNSCINLFNFLIYILYVPKNQHIWVFNLELSKFSIEIRGIKTTCLSTLFMQEYSPKSECLSCPHFILILMRRISLLKLFKTYLFLHFSYLLIQKKFGHINLTGKRFRIETYYFPWG